MAHWNHRRINKGYAGTHSERTQIKKEHELEEHSAFQLHKAVVRHGFRKIRFHCDLDKEQIVVLEIAECTEMEIQQDLIVSLSDNEAARRLRFTPLLSSSKFPAFSASKCLQNSSIIQNNSVTLQSVVISNKFVTCCNSPINI